MGGAVQVLWQLRALECSDSLSGVRDLRPSLNPELPRSQELLTYLGRVKSLVLFGASLTGKTTWARSLGQHVFFGELFSGGMAELITPDVKYAVFDDIRGGITFFHGWKGWLGCQAEFNNKALYKDPTPIKWGRPSIWCANKDPREEMCYYVMGERHFHKGYGQEDIDWLERNCIFVEINSPIFRANT